MCKRLTFIIAMICCCIIGYSQAPTFDMLVGNESISSGCVGVTITFKNTSADTNRAFHWDINGFRINTTSTFFIFSKQGTYPIKLTDEKANTATTKNIVINALPTSSFNLSSNNICIGSTVSFTSTSKGPASILTYYWTFEDESLVTYNNLASHTFNKAGSKKVYLFVKDANGCLSPTSSASTVTVNGNENVSFATKDNSFYSCDNTINFVNTSDNSGNFTWDYGDGTTYTGSLSPTHTYAKPGSHTVQVTLNTAGNANCQSKFTHIVYTGKPSLQINTIDSICSQTSFNLNAIDASGNFSFLLSEISWSAPGGNFLADSTALSYPNEGDYTLTATNKIGCPSPVSKTIHVAPTPKLSISMIPTGVVCKMTPISYVIETNSNTAVNWHLGDGVVRTTTNQDSINYTYGKAGTYSTYVETTNSAGCTAKAQSETITLNDNCVDNGTDSLLNPFFKFTSNCDNKYLVTFEMRKDAKPIESLSIDGTIYPFSTGQLTVQLPIKPKGQTYTVLVKFQDGTYDYAREITVIDETANFTVVNNENAKAFCAQNNFTISSLDFVNSANISNYEWEIKDLKKDSVVYHLSGSTFSSFNYNMPYPSTFQITLTINDKRATPCISTLIKTIEVLGSTGNFSSLSDSVFCKPNANIVLKNTSIITRGNFKNMIWDFGDGTIKQYNSIPDTIQHLYNYTGSASVATYNINLKIIDNDGCTSNLTSYSKYKLYNAKLAASTSIPVYCSTKTVTINNLSSVSDVAMNGFTWSLDNHTQSLNQDQTFNVPMPNVTFPSTYDVNLSVNYGQGISCRLDTIFKDFVKFEKPLAKYTIIDSALLDVCPPYILHLNNLSSGYQSLQWTLSDSIINTSNKDTILYYIERPDQYSIKLNVNGYDNCVDSTGFNFVSKGPKATLTNTNYQNCVPLTTTLSIHSSDPIENYLWAFGDSSNITDPNAVSVTHQYTSSGSYLPTVTIIGTVESGHCFNNLELDRPIKVDEKINLQYQNNYTYCLGDSTKGGLKITANSVEGGDYVWTTDASSASTIISDKTNSYIIVKPLGNTVYNVDVKSRNTCPDESATISVITHSSPIVDIPNSELTIAAGTIFTPNPVVSSEYSQLTYYWTPSTKINNQFIKNPQIISDNEITYQLQVKNNYGCIGEDSLHVTTLCSSSKIMIPSAFTPNVDGKNDVFYIKGYGIRLVNHFIVVDRWGKTVFERNNINANDISNGWDGKIGTTSAVAGTYVYFANVTCSEGNIIPLKGTVVLIR